MIWWSNHKLYLLLHKLAGLHSAKMAISNWANPSPPPTPSSLSLSRQVLWPKKQNQHHRAKVVLFVGARCESLQQTAQLSADMHYTWICINIMTMMMMMMKMMVAEVVIWGISRQAVYDDYARADRYASLSWKVDTNQYGTSKWQMIMVRKKMTKISNPYFRWFCEEMDEF